MRLAAYLKTLPSVPQLIIASDEAYDKLDGELTGITEKDRWYRTLCIEGIPIISQKTAYRQNTTYVGCLIWGIHDWTERENQDV